MSGRIIIEIMCNGRACKEQYRVVMQARSSFTEARAIGAHAGWKHLKGRDYCPHCWSIWRKRVEGKG